MNQIDKNADINQKRIESTHDFEEMSKVMTHLKHYSKDNRKEMTRTHTSMMNQDESHKSRLIEKMKAIEDENQKFKV